MEKIVNKLNRMLKTFLVWKMHPLTLIEIHEQGLIIEFEHPGGMIETNTPRGSVPISTTARICGIRVMESICVPEKIVILGADWGESSSDLLVIAL